MTPGCVVAGMLIVVSLSALIGAAPRASAYTLHAPITISGDAAFTPANGVTGGTGTPADPYIIEGWEISLASTARTGIGISYTTKHFVVRGVYVHGSADFYVGIGLYAVENGTVRDSNVSANYVGISVAGGGRSNLVSGNQVHGNRDVGVEANGGTNLTVLGNTVTGTALPGSIGGAGILVAMSSRDVGVVGNNVSSNHRLGIGVSSSAAI